LIEKIIEAAVLAPMGLPPSDVQLVVIKGKDKVREFSFDVIDYFSKVGWVFSPWMMWMWRLMEKETYQMMKSFGNPLVKFMVATKQKNENYLLYDAPLAMYFSSSPYADPADPFIPATYAMLAAESLGLGSCMIGSVHPIIQYGAKKTKAEMESSGQITIRNHCHFWLSKIPVQIRNQKEFCKGQLFCQLTLQKRVIGKLF